MREKGLIYVARVFLSLLADDWKTSPGIAAQWHPNSPSGGAPVGEYRNVCKGLVEEKVLKSRPKHPKSKTSTDTEYAINDYTKISKFFSALWCTNNKLTAKLLQTESFRKLIRDLIKNIKRYEIKNMKLYEMTAEELANWLMDKLHEIVTYYLSKKGSPTEKELLKRINLHRRKKSEWQKILDLLESV